MSERQSGSSTESDHDRPQNSRERTHAVTSDSAQVSSEICGREGGNKRRRENGQFVSSEEQTEEKRRKAEKRKSYQAGRQHTGKKLFDDFVRLFFLRGSPDDWVPTSSNSGPLVLLTNRLFRPTYLPSQEDRSEKLLRAYRSSDIEQNSLEVDGDKKVIKRVTTRAADAGDVPFSKITAYVGRRLPLVAHYTAEIEPVRDWIKEACSKGYFRTRNCQDAFTICLEVINSYVMVDGKRAYKGYPKAKKAPSSPICIRQTVTGSQSMRNSNEFPDTAHSARLAASLRSSDSVEEIENRGGNITSSNAEIRRESAQEPEMTTEESEDITSGSDDITSGRESSPRCRSMRTQVKTVLEISHDEEAFVLLCLLFDKEAEDVVVSCAGPCLKKDRSIDKVDGVMKDILLYAHSKVFGIKDKEEHRIRKEGLMCIRGLAVKARAAYGLAPYSVIRETYFSLGKA